MNMRLAVIVVTALAAALRFFRLSDESLWFDEGMVYARIAGTYFTAITHWDVQWQGVLFPVIEKAWIDLFGHSEFALRSLPATLGSMAVPAIYLLGSRLFSRSAGLIAAMLLAINPYAIHYSQDASRYSLFLLSSIASVDFALRSLRSDDTRTQVLFILLAAICMYSHAFGVFMAPVYLAVPLIDAASRPAGSARRYVVSLAWIAGTYVPMLLLYTRTLVGKMRGQLGDAGFIPLPSGASLTATISLYFMSDAAAILGSATIVVALALQTYRRRLPRAVFVPMCLIACLMLLPWLASHALTPIYFHRYTTPALAALLLLVGWALSSFKSGYRILLMSAFGVLAGVVLADYYTKTGKDPWRQTVEVLRPRMQAGDVVIVQPYFVMPLLRYYHLERYASEVHAPKDSNGLRDYIEPAKRVWLVTDASQESDLKTAIQRAAADHGVHQWSFAVRDSIVLDPRAAIPPSDIRLDLYSHK